jgi:hypothetical protein
MQCIYYLIGTEFSKNSDDGDGGDAVIIDDDLLHFKYI